METPEEAASIIQKAFAAEVADYVIAIPTSEGELFATIEIKQDGTRFLRIIPDDELIQSENKGEDILIELPIPIICPLADLGFNGSVGSEDMNFSTILFHPEKSYPTFNQALEEVEQIFLTCTGCLLKKLCDPHTGILQSSQFEKQVHQNPFVPIINSRLLYLAGLFKKRKL
jgi:hypothetical protein